MWRTYALGCGDRDGRNINQGQNSYFTGSPGLNSQAPWRPAPPEHTIANPPGDPVYDLPPLTSALDTHAQPNSAPAASTYRDPLAARNPSPPPLRPRQRWSHHHQQQHQTY